MQTLKIKYHTVEDGLNYIKAIQQQYTNLLRWMYNRVYDGFSEKQCEQQTKLLNNIDMLDSWFVRSATKQAQWINEAHKGQKVIFGGRKNFIRRAKGLITKEEFLKKRIQPLNSVGETLQKGNRKFRISSDLDKVVFSPNRHKHIDIIFDGLSKNYKRLMEKLYICQEAKSIPITYQLSQEYLYVMFDEKELCSFGGVKKIKNRVMAIDLNPNYIGWSIVDWKSSSEFDVVKHGVYSLKKLNDKEYELKKLHIASEDKRRIHLKNKRHHEVMEISKNLIDKALYYRCEIFSIENLEIETSDKGNGKNFNRLVNNLWCRDKLMQNIEKRCNLFNIQFLKVVPNYSSFIGNVVFRMLKLADMELSSVEIGRRAYEFKKQYIEKAEKQRKNIVFPNEEDFRGLIAQSLEELGIDSVFSNLKNMYDFLKKSKIRYRLSLDSISHPMFSRFFSKRSLILKYSN